MAYKEKESRRCGSFFFYKGGQAGQRVAIAYPALMVWETKKREGGRQAGQELATARPALTVHKHKNRGG